MYKAVILRLKDVRKHPNADRIQLATCEGNQVAVGLDAKEGDLGIYFPTDGYIEEWFLKQNDLLRRKDEAGNNVGGMFESNGRVRTQKFRGEQSDGFWCPLNFLEYSDKLQEGEELSEWCGKKLCDKYVAPATKQHLANMSGKKAKVTSKMFYEHFETQHLIRNTHKIPNDAHIIITEKLHGTSQRVGHVLTNRKASWWSRICHLLSGMGWTDGTYQDWQYLAGTRRVVLDTETKKKSGFHSPNLRELATAPFLNKLHKGETVFYEVVGFEPEGKPIMGAVDIRKTNDKAFITKYAGQVPGSFDMYYKYGCGSGEHKIFVYRITITNEDGHTIDYSWEDVKKRCKEIGVEYVPELANFKIKTREDLNNKEIFDIEVFLEGESTLDKSHIREGFCLRVEGGLNPAIFKHKSFNFKVLEGLVKDSGTEDMEEAS